jgi:hypothetical protein
LLRDPLAGDCQKEQSERADESTDDSDDELDGAQPGLGEMPHANAFAPKDSVDALRSLAEQDHPGMWPAMNPPRCS